ncbi:polysaccharide biosynthesis tyrosine autokinase [Ferrimonas balearica]|nr:polysaccharide biosynthesis tyrosine autokinase [Ferrimonas balearica]
MPEDSDEIDLIQVLETIWRGKWIVAACTLLGCIAAMVYVDGIAVPRYQATAKILIEPNAANVVDLNSVISGAGADDVDINTQLEIVRSPAMLERLVMSERLYEDPEFNAFLREESFWSLSGAIGALHGLFSGAGHPQAEQTRDAAVQAAIDSVSRSLNLQAQQRTLLFDIRFTTETREKSVRLANELARIYIDEQVNTKFQAVDYAVNWLSERVSELGAEMRMKEDQLQALNGDSELVSAEALAALNLQARNLSERLDRDEEALQAARQRFERAAEYRSQGDAVGLVAFLDDPALRRAVREAGGDPLSDQAVQQRVERLFADLNAAMQRQAANTAALRTSLDDLRNRIRQGAEKLEEFEALVREVEASRTMLETFTSRLKATSLQAGLQVADSRLISPARKALQVEPSGQRTIALYTLIGALLGIGFVLARQFYQQGYRTVQDVLEGTGHPVIGQVPVLPIKQRKQLVPYLVSKPTSAAAEAIRNLRTSISMQNLSHPPQVIALTSSVAGEGKTTIAVSLAMNYAKLGKRVLLLEGDIRRVTLGEYFEHDAAHNIVDVIREHVPLEDAVVFDEQLGADILFGRKTSENAADIFASGQLGPVLQAAREKYDHIIVDTPPVVIVPDAKLIAPYCDAIVYVVHWNRTDRREVSEGLRQLEGVDLNVSGVVLSQIDPEGMKRYGYGAYVTYGSEYYHN